MTITERLRIYAVTDPSWHYKDSPTPGPVSSSRFPTRTSGVGEVVDYATIVRDGNWWEPVSYRDVFRLTKEGATR